MDMRTRLLCSTLGVFFSAPIAVAQDGAPIEGAIDVESTILLTPLFDRDSDIETEPVLGELSVNGTVQKILENGVRVRAQGALRVQADHPSRPGGIGGFGSDTVAPVGAFSGLSSATPIETSDIRARLETAYLQVDGGYGEVRVGKDRGVAARFYEGAKSSLSHARLDSSLLDPTGLATVRTRHDLTGPSLKVSYATPRLIGIRAGASFTPDASADGLDRRPQSGTGGVAPKAENAVELGLNGTRLLRESGWRFDVGLGWSTADMKNSEGLLYTNSVETWSAGTRIEKEDWTFGLSWLDSNNGGVNGDYTAWSAGLSRYAYDTDFSIEFGESEDRFAGLDSESWRLGFARDIDPQSRIGIAYLHDTVRTFQQKRDTNGIVVEITLSQEIVELTGN